jgi:uncharacterized protein (DUF433 family)
MVALQHRPAVKAVVISDPTVMSGDPVVRGTRVLAESIVAYIRAGYTNKQIFEDFPTLPVDGIDAVISWADRELGPDWRHAGE